MDLCEETDFMYPMKADVYYPLVEQGTYGNVKKTWVFNKTVVCNFSKDGTVPTAKQHEPTAVCYVAAACSGKLDHAAGFVGHGLAAIACGLPYALFRLADALAHAACAARAALARRNESHGAGCWARLECGGANCQAQFGF